MPGYPGVETALRVALSDLPPPFEDSEGCKLWVGQPVDASELSGVNDPTPPTFRVAGLQSAWHCMDWSTVGPLHVTDNEIVPNGAYNVQSIDCTADPSNEGNYSAPLTIATSGWGDIVGEYNSQGPNGIVDFNDVSSVVDKFKNLPLGPRKARGDLAPDAPDRIINFLDISAVVEAFLGLPYPFPGPDECP